MVCQVEFGRTIRITCRNNAKNTSIQLYYCVFQYQRMLKVGRHVNVQVVLLLTLTLVYQDMSHEVISKYGGRDISESSLVFSRSKGGEARLVGHYFHNPQVKTLIICLIGRKTY